MTNSNNGVVITQSKHTWLCGDVTVRANTKGEARAKIKQLLKVARLPAGTKLEKLKQ